MHRVEIAGFVMMLHGDNYLEEEIIGTGRWEPETTEFVRSTVEAGMVVADVGANIGYYSLLMASLVGESGQVHAFEPYPGYAARMNLSVEANGFRQIRLNEIALSDRRETRTLFKGLASARMHRWSHPDPVFAEVRDEIVVPCIPFDDYARANLGRLDLLKIDVDGHEVQALKGAGESLRRHRPVVLAELYEEGLRAAGSGARELLELLRSWDYRPFHEDGSPGDEDSLTRRAETDPATSTNVVFRPRDRNPA